MLDNEQAQMVISYIIETIELPSEKQNRTLADLKGKIQFADGYDYKAMQGS